METESTSGHRIAVVDSYEQNNSKRRSYAVFEVPSNFFDFFRFVEWISTTSATENTLDERDAAEEKNFSCSQRFTCNTCNSSFESLHDQRFHFKSDFHRFNVNPLILNELIVKLSIARKDTVKGDDFDEWSSTSFVKDYDISSISGSEDEDEARFGDLSDVRKNVSHKCKKLASDF
ncbi:hypothetical protein L6452_33072 [Arctium lappa]|uniref:Uncharacterized protein n=1 Tax=Arctium lappa TaxID=4217 RepID=A0ACB8Z7H5_ARCLA|nr:hypothetical protein L6452_33072 [Arctium lappa]